MPIERIRPTWHYSTLGGIATLVPSMLMGYLGLVEAKAQIKAARHTNVAQLEAEMSRMELQARTCQLSIDTLLELCNKPTTVNCRGALTDLSAPDASEPPPDFDGGS